MNFIGNRATVIKETARTFLFRKASRKNVMMIKFLNKKTLALKLINSDQAVSPTADEK